MWKLLHMLPLNAQELCVCCEHNADDLELSHNICIQNITYFVAKTVFVWFVDFMLLIHLSYPAHLFLDVCL